MRPSPPNRAYTAIMGVHVPQSRGPKAPKPKAKGKMEKAKPVKGVDGGAKQVLRVFFEADAGHMQGGGEQAWYDNLDELDQNELDEVEKKINAIANGYFECSETEEQFEEVKDVTLHRISYRRARSRKNLAEMTQAIEDYLNQRPEITPDDPLQPIRFIVHQDERLPIETFAQIHFPKLIQSFDEKVERGTIFTKPSWTSGTAFVVEKIQQHFSTES